MSSTMAHHIKFNPEAWYSNLCAWSRVGMAQKSALPNPNPRLQVTAARQVITLDIGFHPSFFSGGKPTVMQISFVMQIFLLFWTKILRGRASRVSKMYQGNLQSFYHLAQLFLGTLAVI